MRHTFSFPFFLFILLLSPFTVSGNLQKAFALTPVADLTGDWSGFAQIITTGDFSCTFSGNVNAHLEQNENNIDGNFSFVITDAKTTNPSAEYECQTFTENDEVHGTIDGSRITLHSSDGGTFSGWYASSGIHLDLASPDYTGTAQLSPTGFTPPAFTPENEPAPPPPEEEQDSDGDGLVDSQDACPNDPADTADGCPEKDTDGDGIPDSKDSCINDPEDYFEGSADGCPEKDSDGDNIYDSIDQCPYEPEDTVGDIDGCPEQNNQEDQYAEQDQNNQEDQYAEDEFFPSRLPDNFFRTNGCGSQEAGIDFVPDFDFAESCNQHDICYARGGDVEDRKTCDEEFYESIKSNSVLGKFGATIYYWAVRLGGAASFNCVDDSCH